MKRHAFAHPARRVRYLQATAGRRPGRRSAAQKYFAEILGLISAGSTFDAACRAKPEFPSREALFDWMAADRGRVTALEHAVRRQMVTKNHLEVTGNSRTMSWR